MAAKNMAEFLKNRHILHCQESKIIRYIYRISNYSKGDRIFSIYSKAQPTQVSRFLFRVPLHNEHNAITRRMIYRSEEPDKASTQEFTLAIEPHKLIVGAV